MGETNLSIRLFGVPAGVLSRDDDGAMTFKYGRDWLDRSGDYKWAHAISLSMPLRERPFTDSECRPFFAGLLPELKKAREALLSSSVSFGTDDFSLLEALGSECAGAVSAVPMNTDVVPESAAVESYEIMSEGEIADMVRNLSDSPLDAVGRGKRTALAGVQAKTSVFVTDDGRIAEPTGSCPSTHIVKTDLVGLKDSVKVENFCLRLAKEVGVPVVDSHVAEAEGTSFILVRRYDRVDIHPEAANRGWRRLHQEDFCQAVGKMPGMKYGRKGGVSLKDAFSILDATGRPTRDRNAFLDNVVFNFLIGNPDAHAKNFSLFYRRGTPFLAPMYDVSCSAAFLHAFKHVRPFMAMTINGKDNPFEVEARDWAAEAVNCGLNPMGSLARLVEIARIMPDAAVQIEDDMRGTPEWSPLLSKIVDHVADRCKKFEFRDSKPKISLPSPGM